MADGDDVPNPLPGDHLPEIIDHLGPDARRRQLVRNQRHAFQRTRLSLKLRMLRQMAGDDFLEVRLPQFSWTTAVTDGMPLNGPSPVPAVMDQEDKPNCIPHAVTALIRLQMSIFCRLNDDGSAADQPVGMPEISVNHLIARFGRLPDQTLFSFLRDLNDNGFTGLNPLDHVTGLPVADAQIYYLHWSVSISPFDFPDRSQRFITSIKECIIRIGGAIVEFVLTDQTDIEGHTVVTSAGSPERVTVRRGARLKTRLSGHAVVLIGWRTVGDTTQFQFLNSHGLGYGHHGLNWIRRHKPRVCSTGAPLVSLNVTS